MREARASAASWHPDGTLATLQLQPLPPEQTERPEAKSLLTPQEREQAEREKRRDLTLRASGGPVMRLDAR